MKSSAIIAPALLGLTLAVSACIAEEPEAEDVGSDQQGILAPSGYGHYCSMGWSGGGWALTWSSSSNGDPCGYLRRKFGTAGNIDRAGMYAVYGINNVVLRCDSDYVSTHRGYGSQPLNEAFSAASGKSGCVFTASMNDLPIFDAPFDPSSSVAHVTGFDFAKFPYKYTYLSDYGTGPDPGLSGWAYFFANRCTMMNDRGEKRSTASFIDDHDGHDWNMPRGTPIYATASGVVRDARWLWTGCTGSDSPIQGEVYLTHNITRWPSTYSEEFVSSYFHLEDITVAPGQWVNRGDVIGYSGNMGCSSGPHLHFATMRLTNTARAYRDTLSIPSGKANDGWRIVIEPYGFNTPKGFDPWAFKAYKPTSNWVGGGALSVNLWRHGEAPTLGSW